MNIIFFQIYIYYISNQLNLCNYNGKETLYDINEYRLKYTKQKTCRKRGTLLTQTIGRGCVLCLIHPNNRIGASTMDLNFHCRTGDDNGTNFIYMYQSKTLVFIGVPWSPSPLESVETDTYTQFTFFFSLNQCST